MQREDLSSPVPIRKLDVARRIPNYGQRQLFCVQGLAVSRGCHAKHALEGHSGTVFADRIVAGDATERIYYLKVVW